MKFIWPELFFSNPPIIERMVDFPHPDGPTNAMNWFSFINKFMFLIAHMTCFFV